MPTFDQVASVVATALEAVMLLVIIIGAAEALVATARQLVVRASIRQGIREIRLRFAAWIVLALEFALAADLIATVIAPSWDEVGKLAAIAAIRTGLSLFLVRDIDEFRMRRKREAKPEPEPEPEPTP